MDVLSRPTVKRLAFSSSTKLANFNDFLCDLYAISACSAVKGFETAERR